MPLTIGNFVKSASLGGIPESVPAARTFIRQVLGEAHPATDTTMLLGSDLVSNAVRHSRSGQRDGGWLTVVVFVQPVEWSIVTTP
jgi:hypothetical protein